MNQFNISGEIDRSPKYEQTESGVPYIDLVVDTTTEAITKITGPDSEEKGGGLFYVRVMDDEENTSIAATDIHLHKGDLVLLRGHIEQHDESGNDQPVFIATRVAKL